MLCHNISDGPGYGGASGAKSTNYPWQPKSNVSDFFGHYHIKMRVLWECRDRVDNDHKKNTGSLPPSNIHHFIEATICNFPEGERNAVCWSH